MHDPGDPGARLRIRDQRRRIRGDGWPSFTADDPTPKISIPNRDSFQFHGTLADFADWDAQIKTLLDDLGDLGDAATPAFVWPSDHTWCVTCDIDPHFASIGAGLEAIDRLVTAPCVDVVIDDPARAPLLP